MCDCFTRRSGDSLCVIFTHKLRSRQCYTTYGKEVKSHEMVVILVGAHKPQNRAKVL